MSAVDSWYSQTKRRKVDDAEIRTYTAQRVLGIGSFGVVYQAQVIETGEYVAIKSMRVTEKDREIQILRELEDHPNIVALKGAFISKEDAEGEPKLNLVLEFVSDTLHRVIKHHSALHKNMDNLRVKMYLFQLMRALNFVHLHGMVHCDVKPQNLLVDGKSHTLKLCDFGTARRLVFGDEGLRPYVCSRYYRAPELTLGSTVYTTSVDIWSAGCLYAEMLLGQPIFTGKDGINQLTEIFKVLGTPTSQELRAMNPMYPEYSFTPAMARIEWDVIFPRHSADKHALNMADSLLRYDPSSRATPMSALMHNYFDVPLRSEKRPAGIVQLFDFRPDELWLLSAEEKSRLIPEWFSAPTPAPSPA